MGAAVRLKAGFDGDWFRQQARTVKSPAQARRCLALAAVVDGLSRTDAAKAGGMDRQTLRDWVHRFNDEGIDGLKDRHSGAPPRKLRPEQEEEILALIEMEPIPDVHGCVRWRLVDLCAYAHDQWDISLDPSAMSRLLKRRGYSLLTARPQHHAQDPKVIESFKKTSSQRRWQKSKRR